MGTKDLWDKYGLSVRGQVAKYAWTILLAVLKEIGEAAMDELAKGLDEFRKQGKTPDGWTREEYLSYAIGRLRVVQARDIGPFVVDEIIDWCIERIIDVLEGKLENLDDDDDEPADQHPVEDPPLTGTPDPLPDNPTPPQPPLLDPYYPTTYGPYEAVPFDRLQKGDRVYKTASNRFAVPVLGIDMPIYRQAIENATLILIVGEDV